MYECVHPISFYSFWYAVHLTNHSNILIILIICYSSLSFFYYSRLVSFFLPFVYFFFLSFFYFSFFFPLHSTFVTSPLSLPSFIHFFPPHFHPVIENKYMTHIHSVCLLRNYNAWYQFYAVSTDFLLSCHSYLSPSFSFSSPLFSTTPPPLLHNFLSILCACIVWLTNYHYILLSHSIPFI